MSSLSKLYTAPEQSVPFPRSDALQLLHRKVQVLYKSDQGKDGRVLLSVEMIYKALKRGLSHVLEDAQKFSEKNIESKFVIKGSSVAHIFSEENFSDIDLQAVIDLTGVSEERRIRLGFNFKWRFLREISRLISQTVSDAPEDVVFSFVEENRCLSSGSKIPYNQHLIIFGSPPIEFSCFALIKDPIEPSRNFDFNSGALELEITNSNEVKITSLGYSVEQTLESISQKKLVCFQKEQLSRNALPRYFSKLFFSGYHDEDPALLPFFLDEFKNSIPPCEVSEAAAQLMNQIQLYIGKKEKDLTNFYLFLWILSCDHPLFEHLKHLATEELYALDKKRELFTTFDLGAILKSELKELICWEIFLRAHQIHAVKHRAQETLKLELEEGCSFLIHVDQFKISKGILGLTNFFKLTPARVDSNSLDAQTKVLLQRLIGRGLFKKELFPLFHQAFIKCSIPFNPQYIDLFFLWASEAPREQIRILSPQMLSCVFSLCKEKREISKELEEDFILCFANAFAKDHKHFFSQNFHSPMFFEILSSFFKEKKESQSAVVVIDFLKKIPLDFYDDQYLDQKSDVEIQKHVVNLTFILFSKKQIEFDLAKVSAIFFYKNISKERSIKLFGTLYRYMPDSSLESFFEHICKIYQENPTWFLKFLQEHKDCLREKQKLFFYLFEPLRSLALSLKDPSHSNQALQLASIFFEKAELEIFMAEILEKAIANEPLAKEAFLKILDLSNLSFLEVFSPHSLTEEQFCFLFEEKKLSRSLFTHLDHLKTLASKAAFFKKERILKEILLSIHSQSFDLFLNVYQEIGEAFNSSPISSELSLKLLGEILLKESSYKTDPRFIQLLQNSLIQGGSSANFSKIAKEEFEKELLSSIRSIHYHFVIDTVNYPVWNNIWEYLVRNSLNQKTETWIDLNALFIYVVDPTVRSRCFYLLSHFPVSLELVGMGVEHVMKQQNLSEEEIEELLSNLFLVGFDSLWLHEASNSKLELELCLFVLSFVERFLKSRAETSPDKASFVLAALRFCTLSSDADTRVYALRLLSRLLSEQSEIAKALMSSGKKDIIIVGCAEKAIEERDIVQFFYVFDHHYKPHVSVKSEKDTLIKNEIHLLSYSPMQIKHRAQAWKKALADFCRENRVKKERFDDVLIDTKFFNSCGTFFEDMYVSLSLEISKLLEDEEFKTNPLRTSVLNHLIDLKQLMLSEIESLIEFVGRKKRVDCIPFFDSLTSVVAISNKDSLVALTTRLFKSTTEMLTPDSKGQIVEVPWIYLNKLINYSCSFMKILEETHPRVVDRRQVLNLLEVLKPALSLYKEEEILRNGILNLVCFLEGSLNKEEFERYYRSTVRSILDRKKEISYNELTLFALTTFRADPKIGKTLGTGINAKLFHDKFLIGQHFFYETKNLVQFMAIFEIAFSRFSSEIPSESEQESFDDKNIFALFCIYFMMMQNGIIHQKTKSEVTRLENAFLSLLEILLKKERNRLTLTICKGVLNFLTPTLSSGERYLRDSPKEDPSLSARLFFQLVCKLRSTDRVILAANHMEIEPLVVLFQKNEKTLRKHLKEEELAQLQMALEGSAKHVTEKMLTKALKPLPDDHQEGEGDLPVIYLSSVMKDLHITSPIEALKALFKIHSISS